jgi:hypothetical protein
MADKINKAKPAPKIKTDDGTKLKARTNTLYGKLDDGAIMSEPYNVEYYTTDKNGNDNVVATGKTTGNTFKDEARVKAFENAPKINLSKGGKVSSASKRADGCAVRGKTRA